MKSCFLINHSRREKPFIFHQVMKPFVGKWKWVHLHLLEWCLIEYILPDFPSAPNLWEMEATRLQLSPSIAPHLTIIFYPGQGNQIKPLTHVCTGTIKCKILVMTVTEMKDTHQIFFNNAASPLAFCWTLWRKVFSAHIGIPLTFDLFVHDIGVDFQRNFMSFTLGLSVTMAKI